MLCRDAWCYVSVYIDGGLKYGCMGAVYRRMGRYIGV